MTTCKQTKLDLRTRKKMADGCMMRKETRRITVLITTNIFAVIDGKVFFKGVFSKRSGKCKIFVYSAFSF